MNNPNDIVRGKHLDSLAAFVADKFSDIGSGSGSGQSYTLPTASATLKGGVVIGDGLSMTGDVLSVPTVTSSNNGLMIAADKTKLDTLSNYSLPTATTSTKGGIIVGTGLSMSGDTLNCTVGGALTLGTTPSTIEGAIWLEVN